MAFSGFPSATTDGPRVLHVTPGLFGSDGGFVGGAERYAYELARHMAEEVPTTLVSFGTARREETVGRLRILVVPGDPWQRGRPTWPLPMPLLAELRRADVVHCHQQHVLTHSLLALLGRVAGRPVYATDLGGGGRDISGYVSTDRWFAGHLHISEYSRTVYGHADRPWGHVIWGGVDVERFRPAPLESDGAALFVGRLFRHKGVDTLIRGLPIDLPLRVVGQPRDTDFVRDLHRLAVGKPVTFHSDFDDVALIDAYQRAMCIVLPSVYRDAYGGETKIPELLGLTLLEGMACGLPAVCTRVASLPELVEEGVSGFVVPPNDPEALGDRLAWLRDHPAEAARMGAAARQRVLSEFTWPAVVRRCLGIYGA